MKLELKHLAPYLPYGIKVLRPDGRTILLMKGLDKDSIVVDDDGIKYCGYEFTKPILRPLSDLTKEIERNGDKFVPAEKLNPFYYRKGLVDCLGGNRLIYWSTEKQRQIDDGCWDNFSLKSFEVSQKLFEWHFDVFGLIPQGLAIDINTLK